MFFGLVLFSLECNLFIPKTYLTFFQKKKNLSNDNKLGFEIMIYWKKVSLYILENKKKLFCVTQFSTPTNETLFIIESDRNTNNIKQGLKVSDLSVQRKLATTKFRPDGPMKQ